MPIAYQADYATILIKFHQNDLVEILYIVENSAMISRRVKLLKFQTQSQID